MVEDKPISMGSKTVEWESDPAGMMEFYQNQPYKLGDSIADLVDNAYDADATKIDVKIDRDRETNKMFVRIMDNGKGISEDKWGDAMMLGIQRARKVGDLGVFGVGLKLSSLSQANEVTVASVHDRKFGVRRISSDHIINTNKNELMLTDTGSWAYKHGYETLVGQKWTTMILLEDVHSERRFSSFDMQEDAALSKEIKRVKVHLRLTFTKILTESLRSNVILSFQGKPLKPLDPMMQWEKNGSYGTIVMPMFIIDANINGRKIPVRVEPVIIPHTNNFDDGKTARMVNSGYKKANEMQGLYLYRNDRLIQYGGWNGMYGHTQEEHNKLGKVTIHIPPKYEKEFGLSPTKTDIQLPLDFIRQLRSKLDEKRQWGQIKGGVKMTFSTAFDHRYRNEGKVKSKKVGSKKTTIVPKKIRGDLKEEKTVEEPIFNPSIKKTNNNVKAQPIVKSIEDNGENTIVTLDNSKNGFKDLIQIIRKWIIE